MKQKILVVNDDVGIQEMFFRTFGGSYCVLSALNLKDGENIFLANRDVLLIVMDGCVDSWDLDSIPLVHNIRETYNYKGPMLASSGDNLCNSELVRAGCSHKIDNPGDLITKVREILGI